METAFIDWLRDRVKQHPQVLLGPGDDAAVMRLTDSADCVVTSDMLTDGVDFILDRSDHQLVGRKALAVNLSDLAAMAAAPMAAIISLALPRQRGLELAIELYEGLLPLAEQFGVAIAGGDTNSWDGPLVISITAIGQASEHELLTRRGAKIGDRILVTGDFGGSILGKHFCFEPRVHEARHLRENYQLNAGTDVSDGLSLDLWNICRESGCGAEINADEVPVAAAASQLAKQSADGLSPLDHALTDGEDFELILAAPNLECDRMLAAGEPLTAIGQFVRENGLWLIRDGVRLPFAPRGYRH